MSSDEQDLINELTDEVMGLASVANQLSIKLELCKSKLKIALEGLELIASGRAVANDMSSFGTKFEDLRICARTTIKNIDEVKNA